MKYLLFLGKSPWDRSHLETPVPVQLLGDMHKECVG